MSSDVGADQVLVFQLSGFYILPVKSLAEPPPELLVREKSEKFIDVQPILCMVRLKGGEQFDPNRWQQFP